MEKREMKMYEAPIVEVVEMDMSAPLLAGSEGSSVFPPTENGDNDV